MPPIHTYPEVIALKSFIKDKNCAAKQLDLSYKIHEFLIPVVLRINTIDIVVHLQYEYDDLSINNPLLTIVLCLQELELIDDSTDYLNWLQFQNIKKNTEKLRSYYQHMFGIIPNLRPKFANNTITSFIPGLDYELNSNSMYYLRQNEIT